MRIRMECKCFGAFVLEAAGYGREKAAAVAVYVRRRTDTQKMVRLQILDAFGKGEISEERRDALLGLLAECVDAFYDGGGRIVARATRRPGWAWNGRSAVVR